MPRARQVFFEALFRRCSCRTSTSFLARRSASWYGIRATSRGFRGSRQFQFDLCFRTSRSKPRRRTHHSRSGSILLPFLLRLRRFGGSFGRHEWLQLLFGSISFWVPVPRRGMGLPPGHVGHVPPSFHPLLQPRHLQRTEPRDKCVCSEANEEGRGVVRLRVVVTGRASWILRRWIPPLCLGAGSTSPDGGDRPGPKEGAMGREGPRTLAQWTSLSFPTPDGMGSLDGNHKASIEPCPLGETPKHAYNQPSRRGWKPGTSETNEGTPGMDAAQERAGRSRENNRTTKRTNR